MNLIKVTLVSLFLMLFTIHVATAQKDFSKDADNAFKFQQYYEAIAKYKKAYTKIKTDKAQKARIHFMIAECYRMINDAKQAESWYARVIQSGYPDVKSILYYADALRANQKYDEAIVQYNLYSEKAPDDARGRLGVEASKMAQTWVDNPTRYVVSNEKKLNSKDNDFSPVYADKKYRKLIFTSAREGVTGKGADAWTGQGFADLFEVSMDKEGVWGSPVALGAPINSEVDEGAATLNEKMNKIYFTRCGQEKKKRMGCQIYTTSKKGDTYGELELILLAPDSFTVGHPTISEDELFLYFASDMPGGFGGRDIWVVSRTSKKEPWGTPVNLGNKVNTTGDEMFPVLREGGVLYYSSNGLPGMGGLDMFKMKKDEAGNWGEPENLKYPLNSEAEDFGIIFEGKEEKGFFTSNRLGSKTDKDQKGRGGDDIWSFYLPPLIFTLQGTVTNDSTKEVLPDATVNLVGSDGTIAVCKTDGKGFYSFDKTIIKHNVTYELTFSKDNFFSRKGEETTVGLENSKAIVFDISLVPIPTVGIELPEILYDLAKWDLKPQYRSSLDGLVKTLKENPKLIIELGSHTDNRPIPMTNDTLSQRRAESAVNYLIEKGIEPGRLVARGYGERQPKILTTDVAMDGVKFTKGTVLTPEYIDSIKETRVREAAHQLNRRTEFRVIGKDYVPTGLKNQAADPVQIINN